MKPKKIDPTKRAPQTPLALRTSAKLRAGGPPAPEPDKQKAEGDPDDDDKDPDDDEGEDAMQAHETLRADAEAKHVAAAEAYKASAGTDSAAALMAAEDAGDAAYSAHCAAKASSMQLRGAEPDSKPYPGGPGDPVTPGPGTAQALSALAGPSAASQMALAQWAGAAQELAGKMGAKTVAQFAALGEQAADALKAQPKLASEVKTMKIRGILAAAVHAGMPRERAVVVNPDGTAGDPLPRWLKMSPEDVTETVTLMGFTPGAPVARSMMIHGAPPHLDDEAGLAQRAKQSGMSLDERRLAEENQRRSAELERGRYQEQAR